MAAKRKRLRAPTTQSSFTAVLEQIQLENRVVAESVTALRDEVRELIGRFDTLEAAVRDLGFRVQALEIRVSTLEFTVKQSTIELAAVKAEVERFAAALRGKAEAKDVAALAERVARLEARVGL